jgi:NADH dehydrogenase FAD-containing subunit
LRVVILALDSAGVSYPLFVLIAYNGQTSVETAGELTDFINEDLKRLYPERTKAMS